MRFFTMEWWSGIQTGVVSNPAVAYADHFAFIRDRLPTDLLATEESVSLHDARLRQLLLTDGTLVITLDSDERFTLTYTEVKQFESTADPEAGLPGPAGYGDLGYCEVDVRSDGLLEHRLLFSTGIELAVVFRGFRLQRARHTQPGAAADDGGS